ncbi:hypothetical protein [Pelagibacterium mangrovi]|uniref:hypothetical protein n=1 Tax=Pelagibacterium mangrovi TaxID=3119828 RepID=UPI002FC9AEE8
MKLGEQIFIDLGKDDQFEIRPSLAHALRLERRPGGIMSLGTELSQGSLSANVAILEGHTYSTFLPNRIMDAGIDTLFPAMRLYVYGLLGVDPDDRPTPSERPLKSEPLIRRLEKLFEVGTGWLGWTAEQTLDALPIEIIHAHTGRVAMLRAIYGGGEADSAPPAPEALDDKFKGIFGRMGTVKSQSVKSKVAG